MIKTLKQLLSCCIAVFLIISMSTSIGATETKNKLNDDEIGLLEMLGIVTEETSEYSSQITRGELANIVAKVANSASITSGKEISPFYDVSKEDKYFNEICSLFDQGIISGDGSGYFNPNKPATYTDAYKMFSLILGYNFAEGRYTYIEMAKKAGILDGIKIQNSNLTVEGAMELAYNTLHCYMFEAVAFGEKTEFQVNKECLALERFHGILELKGVVSGVHGTSLTGPDDKISRNELVINGQKYQYEGGQKLLGMTTVLYIEKEKAKEDLINILYIYADEKENEIFTVNSDHIIDFKNGKLSFYKENEKEDDIDITGRMDVIYNEVAHPNYTDSDFTALDGSISFIDNNDDGTYDVIKINSYSYAVVGAVDINNNIIYTEYPAGKVIGSIGGEAEIEYFNAGRLAYLGGLKKGDVIVFKASKNTSGVKRITVDTLNDPIVGKITSKDDEKIKIDNSEYIIATNMITDIAGELKLGTTVSAYINDNRCAVVLNSDSNAYSVGYMLDLTTEGISFDERIKVMILDYAKQKLEVECVENVRIDGEKYENTSDAISHIRNSASQTYDTASSQWPYSQLVRYKTNRDGKITHIDTLHKNTNEDEESLQLYLTDGQGARARTYYVTNRSFHLPTSTDTSVSQRFEFVAPSTAKVWFIPTNDRMNEEWYRVGHNFTHTGSYVVEAYNVKEFDKEAEYILIYEAHSSEIPLDSAPYIVKEISEVINDDYELCKKISFVGSEQLTLNIRDDLLDVDLSCGDVVQFSLNYAGDLLKIKKVFAPNAMVPLNDRVVSSSSTDLKLLHSVRISYGTAVGLTSTGLVHTTSIYSDEGGIENYTELNNYVINASTPVFIYDSERGKVNTGSVKDILPYSLNQENASQVVVYSSNGYTQYLYIIK